MKDQAFIKELEKATSVSYGEWKDIAILTYLTSNSSVESKLKKKFDLDDKYIKFICQHFLENYRGKN